jgi:cation diffusion facilitator CzcD-associated flavoprotein CzcO
MSKPVYHVAIVGAGLGGLAAAIAISRAGHRVTVIEQAQQLGEVSHQLVTRLDAYSERFRWELVFKYHQIRQGCWKDGAYYLISKPIRCDQRVPTCGHTEMARY